jgi:hypothetical protein
MVALLGLLIALFFAAPGGAATPWTTRAASASVRFAAVRPIRLAGAGFGSGERVRIRIQTGAKVLRRHAVARANGSFTVRTSLAVDPCLGAVASAVGSAGSHAVATTGQRACPPAERSGDSVSRAPQP